MTSKKTTLLVILDGLGINPNPKGNAVYAAKKPTLDKLFASTPNSTLITSGEAVGLPAGQMGNSEVGHLNIGAGRVIEQWLLRIGRALQGSFLESSESYNSFIKNQESSEALHLIGLYSSGGVHSHLEHLKLLLPKLCAKRSSEIFLHLISDGRDTSPNSFIEDLKDLNLTLKNYPQCKIASISGRFFAMDRDKRWERVNQAYAAIALHQGIQASNPIEYIESAYKDGVTDEFIVPALFEGRAINANDSVLFWNFREDRMREIVASLCAPDFSGFSRQAPVFKPSNVLCFTEYDHSFGLPYLFEQLNISNHLGETVSKHNLSQLRVAETEKYPHVTYFLNGGIEKPYPLEERKMVPSPRDVKTYDLKPEMSAPGVTEIVLDGINSGQYDLIVVNLANCDMVGHSGVFEAAVKAVETADQCLGKMLSAIDRTGGQAVIIADHGNAEMMINYEDGTPHTAHTTFPVPVFVYGLKTPIKLSPGSLCDIAPTVLKMMNLPQPQEMSGKALF